MKKKLNETIEELVTMITVTPKDALKAKNLPPGWQVVEVTNNYNKPAKESGATVHYFELTVVDGQFKGVPLNDYTIVENAIGMGKNFFLACGMPTEMWEKAEKGESIQFDENNCKGKIIKVMVKPEPFGNRLLNKAVDFLPYDGGIVSASDTTEPASVGGVKGKK
jgi:hypothetical protein